MRKVCLILLTLLSFSVATGFGAVYHWTGSTDLLWSTAANWSPIRSVSTTADTLVFTSDSTVHDTVVGGANETVAFIKIMPATNIWFQTASGKRTLSIADSLVILSGSSLSVISPTSIADTLVIYLNAGARASIDGSIYFNYFNTTTGPRHRLDAADSLAIQFNSGSTIIQNTIGNIFGTLAGNNRVVFNPGSQFVQYLGSNPFGLSAPNSKVLFKPGSWFRCRMSGSPSFSGRSYANFQLDWPSFSANATGSSPTNIDTLLITDGRLSLQLRHINIKGAVIVLDTLYFNSATTCSLFFNGSTQQLMDWNVANSFMLGAATNVFVDNPEGLLLNSNMVVNCKLHLPNGNIVTGPNEVLLTTDSTIVRGNGYVEGTLWRAISAGTDVVKDYPVGNADGYTPASFTFANVSTGGGASVSVIHGTHPAAVTPENTMKNYWTVSPTGGLVFDTCSAMLGYISADFNTGFSEITDEADMVAGKYDTTAWSFPSVVAHDTVNNTVQLPGIIGFSDFALGKNQEAFLGDLTPPYIVSTSPANGATEVLLDAAIYIAFSEPMDTLSLIGSMTPSPKEEPTWNVTMDTLFLIHDQMTVNTAYIISLTALTDLAGNPLAVLPDSIMFTTTVGDTIAPYIAGISPAWGAIDVGLNDTIVIAFSEPMNMDSLVGYTDPFHDFTPSWNAAGDTFTLVPQDPYPYSTIMSVIITSGIDLAGNSLAFLPDTVISFTSIVGDTVKPYIVSTSPANGATEVLLDAAIYIAFSEPMDTLSLIGSMTPSPKEEPTWNVTMDTLFLIHDQMTVNTAYIISLTALTDLAGNPLAVLPDSIMFTTTVGDTIAPYIAGISPAWGAIDVGLNDTIVIAFSEPMNMDSLVGYTDPFHDFTPSWNAAGDTFTLVPQDPYPYSTIMSVIITSGIDLAGNSLAFLPDTVISFTSIPSGVEGKPENKDYVLQLQSAAPNPLTGGKATFRFSLPASSQVSLEVFNVLGQKVATLANGKLDAGYHTVNWNGTDRNGAKLASGVYIYQLRTMNKTLTKRMTILR